MAEKEYIEREAILALAEDYEEVIDDGADEIFFEYIPVDKVRSLPAADVRPAVRGRWIPDYDYTEYDIDGSTLLPEPREFQDGWQCSLCGGYTPSEANFCPNCGADMR